MKTSDVPKVWRSSPELSSAYEQGCEAGRKGLAAEGNPYREKGPEYVAGILPHTFAIHALSKEEARCKYGVSLCGVFSVEPQGIPFRTTNHYACKRCIRALEAERKRLASAWESGRMEFHPK